MDAPWVSAPLKKIESEVHISKVRTDVCDLLLPNNNNDETPSSKMEKLENPDAGYSQTNIHCLHPSSGLCKTKRKKREKQMKENREIVVVSPYFAKKSVKDVNVETVGTDFAAGDFKKNLSQMRKSEGCGAMEYGIKNCSDDDNKKDEPGFLVPDGVCGSKMEKSSLDEVCSRFMYTGGGNSGQNGIKSGVCPSGSSKIKIGGMKMSRSYFAAENKTHLLKGDGTGNNLLNSYDIKEKGKIIGTDNGESASQKKMRNEQNHKGARETVRVVSPYFTSTGKAEEKLRTKKGKIEAIKLQKKKIAHARKVSPYFSSSQQEKENANMVKLGCPTQSEARILEAKRKRGMKAVLSAAEKRDEAYKRRSPDDT